MKNTPQNVRDLIYFFTHNKKLTREQQAKRDRLLARDCVRIESKAYESSQVDNKKEEDISIATLSKERIWYIPPKNLHSFLYDFNQDSVLKYTCHDIDSDEIIDFINEICQTKEYDFKKHVWFIQNKMESLLKKYNGVAFLDKKFIGMLMAYLGIQQKKWSSMNIQTNWNSNDIIEWSENNPGIIPSPGRNIAKKQKNNGFKLPQPLKSNLTGNRICSFRELVLHFKSLFHIRRDNSLRHILEYQNSILDLDNVQITFSTEHFNDAIEMFTDVEKLAQAYKSILRICREANPEDTLNIELSFYELENSIYFTIHDKNHCYAKTIKNTLERIGSSQKRLIRNQINGLCNLYIEADFGFEEYARIDLWTKDSGNLEDHPKIGATRLDKIEGVKYILEFNWL